MKSTEESESLHASNKHYGCASAYTNPSSMKYKLNIPKACQTVQSMQSIKGFLDYGTGKGGLVEEIKKILPGTNVCGYDPAVQRFKALPNQSFDIITCIDVLEHIEKEAIYPTLQQIKERSKGFVFFAIDLVPAIKKLSDGRNAHIMLAPSDWWAQQLKQHFRLITLFDQGWLEDGTSCSVQLFGCASNHLPHLAIINRFLESTLLTSEQWIYKPENSGFITKAFN